MRLLADQQHRFAPLTRGPDGVVENEAAERRDDDVDDFGRHTGKVDDRDRLAGGGDPQQLAEQPLQRIVGVVAVEDEAVAAVVEELLDGQPQLGVAVGVGELFQPSRLLLQRAKQIGELIRHRAVGGDLAGIADMNVALARLEQAFGDDPGVDRTIVRARGDEGLAMLLQIHRPIGQLEIADIPHLRRRAERPRIFAVRIEDDDMAVRRLVDDPVEQQSDRGRLAGAAGAKHREVPAHQHVEQDRRAHVLGRIDGADLDMRQIRRREDASQVRRAGKAEQVARLGIQAKSALKADDIAVRSARSLAHIFDLGDHRVRVRAIRSELAQSSEQQPARDRDLDDTANRYRCRMILLGQCPRPGEGGEAEPANGARAGGVEDAPQDLLFHPGHDHSPP